MSESARYTVGIGVFSEVEYARNMSQLGYISIV